METGGFRALTRDLLAEDLSDWNPQGDCPTTEAMTEQVESNLDPVQRYVLWMVKEGEYPWPEGGPVVKAEVQNNYHAFCTEKLAMREPWQIQFFPRNLNKWLSPWLKGRQFPSALKPLDDDEALLYEKPEGHRMPAYRMPSLEEIGSMLTWIDELT